MKRNINHRDVGARVKAGRKSAGLTQLEIGNQIGVTKGAISQWESGAAIDYKADNILRLAQALKICPYKLLYNDSSASVTDEKLNNKAVIFALKVIDTIDVKVRDAQGDNWCSNIFSKAYNIYCMTPNTDKAPPSISLLTALLV
jgi:transcriptional regulator with XRE-family HTH domain